MLLKQIREDSGWVHADYMATWKYGYDFMLDAAQALIDTDFEEQLQRVSIAEIAGAPDIECLDDVLRCGRILRNCPKVANETGVLMVAGISSIMECPLQIEFYNQTNVIILCTIGRKLFDEHGENVFTTYMSSMEIKAYCAKAARDAAAGR